MSKPRCPKSGKRLFRSDGAALRAAAEFARQYSKTYATYLCDYCGGWHLSTKAAARFVPVRE